jgi:hypothetical protein
MKRGWYLLPLVALLLAACGPQPTPLAPTQPPAETSSLPTVEQATTVPPTPTTQPATDTPPPAVIQPTNVPATPAEALPAEYPGLPLPTDRGSHFSASGVCSVCHTQMVDEEGNNVSTDTFWRASMMANSARDPYWQASVRAEVLTNPGLQAAIEDKCASCHMAMARSTIATSGETAKMLDDGFLDLENELHSLAMDGVSCTLCHQIREDGFGEPESFSAGFAIAPDLPFGEREAFGPHPVGKGLVGLMQSSSGFVPQQSLHVEQAELCATCHTLYTHYVDGKGEIAGEFPEQMPYLEWLASVYGDSVTCQVCHMPAAKGGVHLSIAGGPPRSPFHQHIFVGGNAYLLKILETFGEQIMVTASSAQFRDKQARAVLQLQERTASLEFEEATIEGVTLTADIVVKTMVGHKFPTGFPARRVWVHLTVQDTMGKTVFESGTVNADGSIVGNDNDADAAAYEPHYQVIDSPDQVQIYEAIMGDTEDEVTTTLLRGAAYLKDNRLPPLGFDKSTVQADIAVRGAAFEDQDFAGGTDRLRYTIALSEAQAPLVVTAELLYQSIGFRWADNLRRYDAPEPGRFLGYYEQIPNQPVVVATATVEVKE